MQKESQIFPPTTGGAEKMAKDMKVPFLGRVPLDPRIGKSCDEGRSFLSEIPDSPAAKAYQTIIQSMLILEASLLLSYLVLLIINEIMRCMRTRRCSGLNIFTLFFSFPRNHTSMC